MAYMPNNEIWKIWTQNAKKYNGCYVDVRLSLCYKSERTIHTRLYYLDQIGIWVWVDYSTQILKRFDDKNAER